MAILPTGIGPVTGYNIERSLRFNSADSAYLNRTPASAGNRDTWTFSGWVKRSKLGMSNAIFFGSGDTYVNFETDRLAVNLRAAATNYLGISTAKFRDVSAWYHIVVAVDTTQAIAADRLKMWVNNQLITAFDVSSYLDIPVNTDTAVNSTNAHNIGRYTGTGEHFDGYMTEINFIDGQQLTPSSFGETDAQTGVWKPKAYSGTYGTNGFFLKFADNSNTTAATLGKDSSGNGNNWTPNNFSVTAGVGNDSLVDSPTNYGTDTGVGGEVRGNYATLNPLRSASSGAAILTNGNLNAAQNTGAYVAAVSTIGVSSGKWYWEVTCGVAGFVTSIGITNNPQVASGFPSGAATYHYDGGKYINGSATGYGASYTNGDVLGFALDMDAGTLVCYKNNTSQGTLISSLSGTYYSYATMYDSNNITYNFGQRAFAYTAPSGFKALCTQNLPTPAVVQGDDYFNTVLYTGTGTSQSITGVGFQPDLVWVKQRSAAKDNTLTDAVRGTSKALFSNTTSAEVSGSWVTAFNSDGFTVGTEADANQNGITFVGWNWKANGAGSSNTAGTITSTVSANTTSGFSIVTYTGTGANATVGHGLGVTPSMVIVKRRAATTGNWAVRFVSLPATNSLYLNLTNASTTELAHWNSTLPTSTVFTVGTDGDVNGSGGTYVAYCFAPVAGYSAFGSYTGNGSTDGPFVYTGFRPRYILTKVSSTTGSWLIHDTVRDPYNVSNLELQADTSLAEYNTNTAGAGDRFDILSNGFKNRSSNSGANASGATYIYAAFAENPFKFSLAR